MTMKIGAKGSSVEGNWSRLEHFCCLVRQIANLKFYFILQVLPWLPSTEFWFSQGGFKIKTSSSFPRKSSLSSNCSFVLAWKSYLAGEFPLFLTDVLSNLILEWLFGVSSSISLLSFRFWLHGVLGSSFGLGNLGSFGVFGVLGTVGSFDVLESFV